jgi:hypothetical protein
MAALCSVHYFDEEWPMLISRSIMVSMLCLVCVTPAVAQLPGGLGGSGSVGNALGGLAGSALPDLSSTSAGNATGVLSYCVKNNILSGDGPTSTLSKLTGRSDVTSSDDYTAGQNGNILTGQGSSFSLSGIGDDLKGKLCNMVLQRAQSFL